MINWRRIDELLNEFGSEDFAEVATLFLAEVDDGICQLDTLISCPEALCEQLHFLKGAALNLGFDALSDLCQRDETMVMAEATAPFQPDEIRRVFHESRKLFEKELPERLAA